MAVELLANAIRKEERLGARSRGNPLGDVLPGLAARARNEGPRRYVQGMRDLLAVLFAGGRAAADECYAEALALARGERRQS